MLGLVFFAWYERPISRAGKEALLKSIIQAIPTYIMSCFQFPVEICEKFVRLLLMSGGAVKMGKGNCIGALGSGLLHLRRLVVWASVTWPFSILLCLPNKDGGC